MTRHSLKFPLLLSIFVMACGGCGSGGSGVEDALTDRNQDLYSDDAVILAARVSTDAWISARQAALFDADLKAIRARFPVLTDIHALPDFAFTDLLIAIYDNAPWIEKWKRGQIRTGDPGIDSLGSRFGLRRVEHHGTWFTLRFGQSLNMRVVARMYRSASRYVEVAEPNGIIGDGDNIRFASETGIKKYTFSKGWGDCIAGCTARHLWEVRIHPDGEMEITESGDPLDFDPNAGSASRRLTAKP